MEQKKVKDDLKRHPIRAKPIGKQTCMSIPVPVADNVLFEWQRGRQPNVLISPNTYFTSNIFSEGICGGAGVSEKCEKKIDNYINYIVMLQSYYVEIDKYLKCY